MKITPELLDRYAKGKCTGEERQFLQTWLDSANWEESNLQERDLKQMKQEVWATVGPRGLGFAKIPNSIYRYAAGVVAISVVSALAFRLLVTSVPILMSFTNFSEETELKESINGMELLLKPESRISGMTSSANGRGELDFCGFVELDNFTGRDILVEVKSNCAIGITQAAEFNLRNGEKYLFFTSKYKREEIHVVNTRILHELPLRLWHEALDQLENNKSQS
ncbi:hypothetical protein J2X69_003285 [Algoriphagus sp. 4150]|uniref:hypothetical protein n=1 Tax=Algoriphagus sp. 4150 TaxID=2817756 RepID=UPI0028652954|nr:hypothetical protein [Algoriphagus sp. 4150]MDR7130926.1 hypothetical protein [Algoriphagus sp. 4150]